MSSYNRSLRVFLWVSSASTLLGVVSVSLAAYANGRPLEPLAHFGAALALGVALGLIAASK